MKQKQLLVSGGPVLDSEGRVMSDREVLEERLSNG